MKATLLSLALLTGSSVFAATPIDGWYMSAAGGYTYLPSNIYKISNNAIYTYPSYEAGFDVGGTFGYQSTPMRYEGEITYFNANIRRFYVNGLEQNQPSGYNNAVAAMANVFYDFPALIMPLQPFVGIGIGYAWVGTNLEGFYDSTIHRFSTSDSVFAYQGMVGVTFNFAENYALTIDYRYLNTTNVFNMGRMFQAQTANVGAIYRFDGNRYQ